MFFNDWLHDELNKRGWSNLELSKRSGVATSTISMIVSGQNKPGYNFCVRISRPLKLPPEIVLRKAGLLPKKPEDNELNEQLLFLFEKLPSEQKSLVLLMIRALVEGWPNE